MAEKDRDVLMLVDRHSFPVNCPELEDVLSLMNAQRFDLDTESPTTFFNQALKFAEQFELVVPVTRNMYVRDRLRQEGVITVVCI